AVAGNIVRRWTQLSLATAFEGWRDSASSDDSEHRQQALRALVSRWRRMGMAKAFERWDALSSHAKSTARRLAKALWQNRAVGAALRTWAAAAVHERRLRHASSKIITRWRHIGVAAGFSALLAFHARQARRRLVDAVALEGGRRSMRRYDMMLLHKALVEWGDVAESKEESKAESNSQSAQQMQDKMSAMEEQLGKETSQRQDVEEGFRKLRSKMIMNEKLVKMGERAAMQEVGRRKQMARQTIARMLNGQAAGVFDSFVAAVVASKERRAAARKVVVRLLNMHLAAAFDWFCEVVQGMQRHRASVAVVIARWKAPSLKAAMDAWVEVVAQQRDETRDAVRDKAMRELRDQLAAAALEEAGGAGTLQVEVARRVEQAKRMVDRMLHSQLAGVFDGFCDRVQASKERKVVARKVISRMLNGQLAGAFELFFDGVSLHRQQRETAQSIIAKWRSPAMRSGFEGWQEYMDLRREEVKDEATRIMAQKLQALELESSAAAKLELENSFALGCSTVSMSEHVLEESDSCAQLVALSLDVEYDCVVADFESWEAFNLALEDDVASAAGVPRECVAVLFHQNLHKAGVVATCAVFQAPLGGESTPRGASAEVGGGVRDARAVALDLVAQAGNDESALRGSRVGRFCTSRSQVLPDVSAAVCRAVRRGADAASEQGRETRIERDAFAAQYRDALVRHVQLKQKGVARMRHIHLATAFDLFLLAVRGAQHGWSEAEDTRPPGERSRGAREEAQRRQADRFAGFRALAVGKMLHAHVARAFGCWVLHVALLRDRRRRVGETLSAWRETPASRCFEGWVQAVEDARRGEDATLKREMAEEIDRLGGRVVEQAKRAVGRMFHIQLATAFDAFHERSLLHRERREVDERVGATETARDKELSLRKDMCRKTLARMLHSQLAGAFD
ncbi:hypothetical protein T484DRAFT_1811568, partial [Baffinella frigidus]